MNSKKDKNSLRFIGTLLFLGGIVWLCASAWHRQEMDYALTEAVSRHDIHKARQLLAEGASPNARWSGYSWDYRLDVFLHHKDDADDCTVLYWARHVQHDGAMERLLTEYGATR